MDIKKLYTFFIMMVMSSSALAADGPCWDVGADYYFSNSASAAAACQLAADASQYTAYCTIWNLYPPTDPSGFYICQGASSANYANWFWGDYPQFDWEDPVTGELKVSNAGTCVLPDVYNPSNNLCEGDNSQTCSALEIYDSLSNSCLDAPVGYGCENGMTLLSSGNTTMDGCVENPPTCTAFAQTSFYGDSIDLCQEQKIACESGGSEYSYGTVGTATGTQQLCYYHPEGYTSSCSDGSGLHLSLEDAENYALLCSDINLPDDVCDPTRNDCDGDGQLDDTDKDGCLDNGVSNGTCIGSTNTGSSTSLIPQWQDPFGTAKLQTGRCDPTSIDYADCVGLTGSIDLTQTEDTLADILASLNGEGNENTITPSDSDTEASYFVTRMNQVPIVAAMDGAFTFSGDATCPAPTFDIFGQTFALNYHCTLYPTFSGMLSSLMLVLYSIYGIRHVMSA